MRRYFHLAWTQFHLTSLLSEIIPLISDSVSLGALSRSKFFWFRIEFWGFVRRIRGLLFDVGDTDLGRLRVLLGFVTTLVSLFEGSFQEENEQSLPLIAKTIRKKKVQIHASTREHNHSLSLL